MNDSIKKKQQRIDFLKKRIRDDKAEIVLLERDVRDALYLAYYEKVISKPIEWERMVWPTRSYPAPGGDGMRPMFKCVVCLEQIGTESHWNGCHMGSGFRHPYVHVHERCVPERVRKLDALDLY